VGGGCKKTWKCENGAKDFPSAYWGGGHDFIGFRVLTMEGAAREKQFLSDYKGLLVRKKSDSSKSKRARRGGVKHNRMCGRVRPVGDR